MQELSSQVMSISIDQAEREYLQWRMSQGFARATVRNDKSAIKIMRDTLGDSYAIDVIDDRSVTRVLDRASNTRSAASVNMIHSSLSAFFKWCRMRRYMGVDNDPLLGMRYKRVPKKERRRLAIHEFPAFLDAAANPRDRAACSLGLYLFLRSSEVVSLRIRDLDLQAGTIGVTVHKTADYDVMPISRELDRELRTWLSHYQNECGPLNKDWFLVPAKTLVGFGTYKLNPTAKISRPEEVVKKTVGAYGWEDTHWQGFHLLRASGARAWFDELDGQTIDGALKTVQAHLHHSSVTMTERYLGLTADRVKRDRLLKGMDMFPSLKADNVIPMRKEA
jgi:integrase